MRKNRKRTKKMSVVASNTMRFGAVILVLVVMVFVNFLASSSSQHLMASIGEKERQLAKLEEERVRESARWDEMKTPEKIESALLRHGLAMRYPKPDQVVRMKADGCPYPGQLSVERAKRRNGVAAAQLQDESTPYGKRRSQYRRSN